MTGSAPPVSEFIEKVLSNITVDVPAWTKAQAQKKMCPLLSTVDSKGRVNKVHCMMGQCVHWSWLIDPAPVWPGDPPGAGLGKCHLPTFVLQSTLHEQLLKAFNKKGDRHGPSETRPTNQAHYGRV